MLWFQRANGCKKRRQLRDRHQNGQHPAVESLIPGLAKKGRSIGPRAKSTTRPLCAASPLSELDSPSACRLSLRRASRFICSFISDLLPDILRVTPQQEPCLPFAGHAARARAGRAGGLRIVDPGVVCSCLAVGQASDPPEAGLEAGAAGFREWVDR